MRLACEERESRGGEVSTNTQSANARSFALERFVWAAPDRLELAGTFSGLDERPDGPPILVLRGGDHTHRLPAAAGDVSGAPENGRPWRAAFVWQEPPVAFEGAVLRLGADLAVELPDPGEDGDAPGNVKLPVRSEPGAERLRLEAELLAGREELHEARTALRRAEEELTRARDDLRTERDERAADATRFREALAQMSESAEDALAARDAELADVRGELEVAVAFRQEAEAAAQAELAGLRERLDDAEAAAQAEITGLRERLDETRRRLETIREALDT
jgi:hypothetical protein